MKIDEFEKVTTPKAKRSKLAPFYSQIQELREKGYANWQVCEWLKANGVQVSEEGVRKFIKSKEGAPTVQTKSLASIVDDFKSAAVPDLPDVVPPSPKVLQERKANKYIGSNPLAFDVDNIVKK
jgi:hypothetical protein